MDLRLVRRAFALVAIAGLFAVMTAATVLAGRASSLAWSDGPSGVEVSDYGFGQVQSGSSVTRTFVVTNEGLHELPVRVTFAGGRVFTTVSDGCTGRTLGAAGTCTVTVRYTPSSVRTTTASLRVLGAQAPAILRLSGTGVPR